MVLWVGVKYHGTVGGGQVWQCHGGGNQLSSCCGLGSNVTVWWWCRPHPVREHTQDPRPPLGARPASPPTRQAAQPPPRGPSTNPRPLV